MTMNTPGPWRAEKSIPSEGVECFWISAGEVFTLGSVYGPQEDRQQANAHLIAAAPDLLWACEALLSGSAKAPLLARAAIAKAKGEAP